MNIISSTYVAHPQADGRSIVIEAHIDLAGLRHQLVYTAAADDDLDAAMAGHAVNLGNDLAQNEIITNISLVSRQGSQATLSTVYSSQADNAAAFFAAYQDLAGTPQGIMLGDYANSLPDVTLEALYGITADQLATIRANTLQPAATAATAIRGATPPVIPGQ